MYICGMGLKYTKKEIPIEREYVDTDTGELKILPDKMSYYEMDLGNWFKMMVIDNEIALEPLESLGKQFMMFYVILKRVIWVDGTVDIGTACKKNITDIVKIKDGMIARYLKSFCEVHLLRRIKGSSYMINPHYFFIGDKREQIKLIEKFSKHGRGF